MATTSTGATVMIQGRLVWLSGKTPFAPRQKMIFGTQTPQLDPQGNPKFEYGWGLAVPKADFAEGKQGAAMWAAIHNEMYQIYPSRQIPPAFATKYKDGDGIDHNGQPMNTRAGHAGCLIFALTTSIAPQFFRQENGKPTRVEDGIKCGDYVQVQVQVKAHGAIGQGKPGMYLNPLAVMFLGYGEPIVNAPSGDQIFGNQPFAMPAGASATPIGNVQEMPQVTQAPGPNYGQPQMVQPFPNAVAVPTSSPMGVPSPVATQSAPVVPNFGVLPQAHQPQQVAMPSIPQIPGVR